MFVAAPVAYLVMGRKISEEETKKYTYIIIGKKKGGVRK